MPNNIPIITAIITARGGSKGLPRKNLLKLCGKPMISFSIEAAHACPYIDHCYVTTDDQEIKSTSVKWGALIIDRPTKLATSSARSSNVVKHALLHLINSGRQCNYFVLLQPTSPLRTSVHITECIEMFFRRSRYKSAISVVETDSHPYKSFSLKNGSLQPLFGFENLEKPRQTLPKIYNQNGAIYLAETESFLKFNTFAVPPVMPYVMDRDHSIDIDDMEDLIQAQRTFRKRGNL
jgi:CMP-N,N'-diacetyllegionaminic acid synthase